MGNRIRKMWIYSSLTILMPFLLCIPTIASADPAVPSQKNNGALIIGLSDSIASANPFVGISESDELLYSFAYDCLTSIDEDGLPTPNLAESWWYMDGTMAALNGVNFSNLNEFSIYHNATDWPSGSIWEYNLTTDVFWNDGVPFSADDVVFTINVQIGNQFLTYWRYQAYTYWIDHAAKVDDNRVMLFFADMNSHGPAPISWGDKILIPILPSHAFEGKPSTYIAQTWDGMPIIATGPFKGGDNLRQELLFKEQVNLIKNEYYDFTENGMEKGLGHHYNRTILMNEIVLKIYSSRTTLVSDLELGRLDVAELNPSEYTKMRNDLSSLPKGLNLTRIVSTAGESKSTSWYMGLNYYGQLNQARFDPAVLRAAALAVNKSRINHQIYYDMATNGTGILYPSSPTWTWTPGNEKSFFNVTNSTGSVVLSYNKSMKNVMDYDPVLSNEILDAAGYVWDNSSEPHFRKVGPEAAARLVSLNIVTYPAQILDKKLQFDIAIYYNAEDEISIGEFISDDWKEIGINLTLELKGVEWSSNWEEWETNEIYEKSISSNIDPISTLYLPTSYASIGRNYFGLNDSIYDHYFRMQSESLSLSERAHWVGKCIEWQYLSGAIITTSYPQKCFGYNEDAWSNWGNWTEHPGLAIDNYWGEAPILFHLGFPEQTPPTPPYSAIVAILGVAAALTVIIAYLALKYEKRRHNPPKQQ